MRKRITLQDKKILIYEIHQEWAREHLEKLTVYLDELFHFTYVDAKDSRYLELKGEIKLNLRLLEFSTRKLEPEFFGKKKENK